jgi:hypothetical protein
LLRLCDVGSSAQEVCGQHHRHCGDRQGGQRHATLDGARILAEQHAQAVFLTRDCQLQRGDQLLGRMIFGLGLLQLELRRIALLSATLRNPERFGTGGHGIAHDRETRIERAQADVAGSCRGRDRELHVVLRCLRREQRRARGFGCVTQPTEQVEIVGSLDPRLLGGLLRGLTERIQEALALGGDDCLDTRQRLAVSRTELGTRLFDARGRNCNIDIVRQRTLDDFAERRVAEALPPLGGDFATRTRSIAPCCRRNDGGLKRRLGTRTRTSGEQRSDS